jgi:hypothetical protein
VPNDTKNDTPSGEDKVSKLEAMVTTLTSKIEKLGADTTNGLSGLRSMYDRQLSNLRTQLSQARSGDGSYDRPYNRGTDDGDQGNQGRDVDPFAEQDRFERGRDRFERTNKLYSSNPEIKKRVDALMADRARRDEILVEREGRIDYERSYRTAYLIVRDQIAEEAEIAAAQARTQADEDKKKTKADAVLSGDSAEELPEGLTLDSINDMSADDMVKKGLVQGVKRHKPLVGV